MTPPRSISPISTTGTSAASANPMLAMSPARRLISAGLPAPSTSTRSASAREPVEGCQHVGQQPRRSAPGSRAPPRCADTRPSRPPARPLRSAASAAPGSCRLTGAPRTRAPAGLRPADLAAVCGHGGVVRHVLRLERPHPEAAPREGAAKPATSSDLPTSDRCLAASARGSRRGQPWSLKHPSHPALSPASGGRGRNG